MFPVRSALLILPTRLVSVFHVNTLDFSLFSILAFRTKSSPVLSDNVETMAQARAISAPRWRSSPGDRGVNGSILEVRPDAAEPQRPSQPHGKPPPFRAQGPLVEKRLSEPLQSASEPLNHPLVLARSAGLAERGRSAGERKWATSEWAADERGNREGSSISAYASDRPPSR
jgi:hypothetical protein